MSVPLHRLRRPAGRLAALPLLLGLCALAAPALAEAGGGSRLTPQQAAKIFPDRRALALRDHRARITILERGERCIAGAADGDALRNCLREERSAMMRQRQESVEAMRRVYERNGLPVPQWKGRRMPGGSGADGAEAGGGMF